MRGHTRPSVHPEPSELQNKLSALSRHRRQKVAKAAHTTLVKVDQWARGDDVATEIAGAIERATLSAMERKSKKKA